MSTDFNAFADAAELLDTDVFLVARGGGGVNVPASAILKKDASDNVGLGTSTPAASSGRSFEISGIEARMRLQATSGRSWDIASGGNFQYTPDTLAFVSNFHGGNAWLFNPDLHFLPGGDAARNFGSASARVNNSYFAAAPTITSDERAKAEIGEITNEWLDAWADVQWSRYKMVGGQRWHIGLVAQQVHAAFESKGLDAFEIGLCCFDAWDEERAPIFETITRTRKVEGVEYVEAAKAADGSPLLSPRAVLVDEDYQEQVDTGKTRVTLEAGDRWGLRYDECFAMEAAWQRREIIRQNDRIAALESLVVGNLDSA